MATERFSTAVICMDGRVQGPAHAFIQGETSTQYTDTITGPGIEKQIDEIHDLDVDHPRVEYLRAKLTVSTKGHNSEGIIFAKHEECLGNPNPDDEEKTRQLLRGATLIERINTENGVGDLPVFTIGVRRDESGLWIAEKTFIQPASVRAREVTATRQTVHGNQATHPGK
jgi:hypothetical protein